ncbi:MAG: sulfotransferase [Xenococcaceae cyanobacterium MO_207.B15]|nr:sulfotransferase [Xenococcaceae cyanobacterium MO_207.B15]
MKKKILFILGTAHCGSTLLSLILDSSPQCFTVGELSNLPRLYKSNKAISQNDCNFWNTKFSEDELNKLTLGLSNARISPGIPLMVEKFFRELVKDDIFRPYSIIASKSSADVIIDSTKTIYWISSMLRLQELKREFDIYLLHLVRDGRAILNSYLKRRNNKSIEDISKLWLKRVTNNEKFFKDFSRGNKIQLAYEKLATKPEETTKHLCDFLGIEFIPEMINYWEYEHHIISGNRGTKSLIKKSQSQPEASHKSQDLSIKLDLSWQTLLTEETIQKFYAIIGDKNKPYEWNT